MSACLWRKEQGEQGDCFSSGSRDEIGQEWDGDRESYSPTARHASTVDTRANPVNALLP
ncbi:hypothetical protein DER46DRAFT_607872 [Fusarium sp. MPI-SDFR-AT-0072]|nr:hypothetical protein DER46DRAFT_607872 [Fusarium sp. MPI-SDFR-AT-0072]